MLVFRDILGHEMIKEHFQEAIEVQKVSHAHILSGEVGMGRKSLANVFTLTLLCKKGKSQPCMECHACKQVLSGNHPDLVYVHHEKPTSIGADDTGEQTNDTIMIWPYSSYYKIYIVDETEKMTVQVQNALLKTIEESPAYAVVILLIANPDALLPMILSRRVQLKLRPPPDNVVRGYLVGNMGISENNAELYAAFSRGNLGKAIKLAGSEEFRVLYDPALFLLKHVRDMDISELLDYIRKLKDENLDIHGCLDLIRIWYRDTLMFKVTNDASPLISKDEYTAINEMSKNTGYDRLENVLRAIDKARVRLDANVNFELAMELVLLAMKED